MSLSIPTLYLNTSSLQDGDSNPFLTGTGAVAFAGPWSRVSGATGPLLVVLCEVAEGTATAVTLASGNTLHYIAKADPADADLAVEIDFEETADGYQADSANLAVPVAVWASGKPAVTLVGNFEERNAGGDVLRIWQANIALTRGVGDGGSPVPEIYVKTVAQTLSDPKQAQARANIGAGTGNSDFDPENPGPIGGTTPAAGTFTVVNLPALPSGDANTALSQDGSILSVENGAPIGASGVNGVAKIMTQSDLVAFLTNSSPTLSAVSVPFTAARGAVNIGGSTTSGHSQEWLDGAGAVAAYFDINGNLIINSLGTSTIGGNLEVNGDITGNVNGNAGTATALATARTIFGQSFNGTANIGGGTITLAGNLTLSGAYSFTGTLTGTTTVTFPTTGTLATLAGTETLTNKTMTSPVFSFSTAAAAAAVNAIASTQTLTDGATISWATGSGIKAKVTLGGNRTMAAPTNLVDGGTYALFVIQDGTGSRTVTWNSVFKWPNGTAPTLSTTAAAVDILTFISDGTNLYGVAALKFS